MIKKYIPYLIVAVVASGAGYYFAPSKVITKTKTVEVVREVEVQREVRDTRRDVETETRIRENPDGSRETIIVERERSEEVVRSESERAREESATESSEKLVIREKKAWLVSAGVGVKVDDELNQIFMGAIQRRILGEIYVGGWATTDGKVGVGLTIRF